MHAGVCTCIRACGRACECASRRLCGVCVRVNAHVDARVRVWRSSIGLYPHVNAHSCAFVYALSVGRSTHCSAHMSARAPLHSASLHTSLYTCLHAHPCTCLRSNKAASWSMTYVVMAYLVMAYGLFSYGLFIYGIVTRLHLGAQHKRAAQQRLVWRRPRDRYV